MVAKKRKYRKISNTTTMGFEPQFDTAKELSENLSQTLTWYHYNKGEKDAIKYVETYLKSIKYPKNKIQKIVKLKKSLNRTFAWCCRIATINSELPETIEEHIKEHLKKLDLEFEQTKEEKVEKEEKPKKRKPTIQENLTRQANEFCWLLEADVDSFIERKCKKPFEPENWFKAKNVKSQQCETIREHFKTYIKDYKLALSGDEDFIEAYNHMTKPELKRLVKLLDKIISDTKVWEQKSKSLRAAKRKPRKRKPRSPLKQIEKLNYLESCEDY
jgi:uncharacterized protein (DUF2164 family)